MKVGVVTFHSAHNYGASLQTWALQKALKKLGAEPCVVNYHPEAIDRLYRVPKLTLKKKIGLLKNKTMRNRRERHKLKFAKYTAFLNENLKLVGDYQNPQEVSANPPKLDAYITGSDQVWNPDHTRGYDPTYLLEFAEPGALRVAYAASVGKAKFPKEYVADYQAALQKFDAISVRERSSAEMVAEVAEKPVSVVIDPTLLLDRAEYDEIKTPVEKKEKYILVYMMENNPEMVKLVDTISVLTGLPVIQRRSVKYFKNELPSFYTDTPGEFLSEVENAEFVITNSFHGTVFSIIYEKPFISLLHSQTGRRTIDLLKELGVEDHIVYQTKDFKRMSQFEIKNPDEIKERIAQARTESLAYLREALKLGGK